MAVTYPAVWGLGQLATGAISDRVGRKWMIAVGMWLQAAAIGMIAEADSFGPWPAAAVVLGTGTAMVYPTCWPQSMTSPTPPGGPRPWGVPTVA